MSSMSCHMETCSSLPISLNRKKTKSAEKMQRTRGSMPDGEKRIRDRRTRTKQLGALQGDPLQHVLLVEDAHQVEDVQPCVELIFHSLSLFVFSSEAPD